MSLEAEFPTIGTLDTTLPPEEDPLFQSASLSLTIHQIIKNLSDEGFVFKQAVAGDFTTFGNNASDGVDDYIDRFEDMLQTGTSAVVADIPDVLPIIGALLSGGAEPVMAILLQGVLDTMLRHWDKRADVADGEPSGVDLSGIEEKLTDIEEKLMATVEDESLSDVVSRALEEMRVQLMSTLNTFNINLHDDTEESTWSVGPVAPE